MITTATILLHENEPVYHGHSYIIQYVYFVYLQSLAAIYSRILIVLVALYYFSIFRVYAAIIISNGTTLAYSAVLPIITDLSQ